MDRTEKRASFWAGLHAHRAELMMGELVMLCMFSLAIGGLLTRFADALGQGVFEWKLLVGMVGTIIAAGGFLARRLKARPAPGVRP